VREKRAEQRRVALVRIRVICTYEDQSRPILSTEMGLIHSSSFRFSHRHHTIQCQLCIAPSSAIILPQVSLHVSYPNSPIFTAYPHKNFMQTQYCAHEECNILTLTRSGRRNLRALSCGSFRPSYPIFSLFQTSIRDYNFKSLLATFDGRRNEWTTSALPAH
jgi:hypothetical protein